MCGCCIKDTSERDNDETNGNLIKEFLLPILTYFQREKLIGNKTKLKESRFPSKVRMQNNLMEYQEIFLDGIIITGRYFSSILFNNMLIFTLHKLLLLFYYEQVRERNFTEDWICTSNIVFFLVQTLLKRTATNEIIIIEQTIFHFLFNYESLHYLEIVEMYIKKTNLHQ